MKKKNSKTPTKRRAKLKSRKFPGNLPVVPMNVFLQQFHVCDIKSNTELGLSQKIVATVSKGLMQFGMMMLEALIAGGHDVGNRHIYLNVTFDTGNHPVPLPEVQEQTETIQ